VTDIDAVIAFYRARLDEDVQAARYAIEEMGDDRWQQRGPEIVTVTDRERDVAALCDVDCIRHIVRHDPARVLKKVTAGRGLIRLYEEACERIDYLTAQGWEAKGSKVAAESYANAILVNAAQWDDHQDWHAAWRPGWMDESWFAAEPLPHPERSET
jgi:hypothetical protein